MISEFVCGLPGTEPVNLTQQEKRDQGETIVTLPVTKSQAAPAAVPPYRLQKAKDVIRLNIKTERADFVCKKYPKKINDRQTIV